jgi:hypothetical protein
MPRTAYQPYNKTENAGKESELQEAYVNTFTPINKPKSKLPIMDSNDIGDGSRHPVPYSPGASGPQGPPPIIDWTASGISAAAIRRECGARVPPIYIPSRLHVNVIKSKYGPMLMELDKEKGGANPVLGRKRSLSPKEMNEEMQKHKETFRVRDYTNALQSQEARGNEEEDEEAEDEHSETFIVETQTLAPDEEQPSESGLDMMEE